MTNIITATDFSSNGNNAAYYAADLAKTLHANIILYHAIENTALATDSTFAFVEAGDFDLSFCQLEDLKDKLRLYTDEQIAVKIALKFGTVNNELKELCRQEQPLMIVIAATQKHFLDRLLTGSHTLALSKYNHIPLLLIPEKISFTGLNKVAIATDFKAVFNTMPLDRLSRLLNHFDAALDIVTVIEPGGMHGSDCAEAVALQTHFNKFNPQLKFIENDDMQDGLNSYISEEKPDLLIVIPKHHNLLHKSHSKQFILHPSLPVLIVRS
jgi:nucleotide-binding universal stress UspA family protein